MQLSAVAPSTTLLQALRAQLGDGAVLDGGDVPPRNENDHSSLPPVRPMAVLRPADTAGVAAAMRLCHDHGQPVVPQGGLTGLCGGARAVDGAVALSLERLVGIDEIDPSSATITVRAGTPLQAIQQAVDEAGFFFPLDLGARGSCAIGGNLSTNAGGNRVIRYGMAREIGARGRGRAARRHRRRLHEQDAEEQRGLRPEASIHRQRRHARHHHQGRAADVPEAGMHDGGAVRGPGLRARDHAVALGAPACRPAAVGLRGDVARLLGGGHGQA